MLILLTVVDLTKIVRNMCDFTQRGDGAVLSTSMCLESDVLEACREYTQVIVPGAGVTPRAWTGTQLEAGSLKSFLDRFRQDEVVYISFG